MGVGGVGGHACFGWRGQKTGGRRPYSDTGNVCAGEINIGDLKYLRLELGKDTPSFIDGCEMKSDFNSLFFRLFLSGLHKIFGDS